MLLVRAGVAGRRAGPLAADLRGRADQGSGGWRFRTRRDMDLDASEAGGCRSRGLHPRRVPGADGQVGGGEGSARGGPEVRQATGLNRRPDGSEVSLRSRTRTESIAQEPKAGSPGLKRKGHLPPPPLKSVDSGKEERRLREASGAHRSAHPYLSGGNRRRTWTRAAYRRRRPDISPKQA